MSISAIPSPIASPLTSGVGSRNDVTGNTGSRVQPSRTPITAPAPKPALTIERPTPNTSANATATAAPAGTDPALWAILTSAERDHFAVAGARGPLTYGFAARTQSSPTPGTARGGRLDVKV